MYNPPETPTSQTGAPPRPAPHQAPAPAGLRLPSTRASALLAAVMLVAGVAVGAAIGPAPESSFAGAPSAIAQSLPLLLSSLRAGQQTAASGQAGTAAAQPPAGASRAAPAAASGSSTRTSSSSSRTSASRAPSPSPATQGAPEPSTGSPTSSGGSQKATLPPVTSIWLIELAGVSFAEALATPAAAPYIDGQVTRAGTLLSGWSALTGSAFASDAALSEHRSALGASPALLHSIAQPPCPEGPAGAPCAPGTPGALSAADEFLKATLAQITPTAAYREHGLIVVTFATIGVASQAGLPAGASTATLTSEPPGGVLLMSPFARAGARSSTTFNPSSPEQSLAKLLH